MGGLAVATMRAMRFAQMARFRTAIALTALAVAVGLGFSPPASAATGTVSVPMPGVGAINVNMAGGSTFTVNTPPNTNESGTPMPADYWHDIITLYSVPNPQIYTVFCWKVWIASVQLQQQINNSADWKCGVMSVVPAPTLITDIPKLSVTGTLDTDTPNSCSWVLPYDPVTGDCGGNWTDPDMGNASPTGPDMMPNFDPYVGQTLSLDVLTNWCSYAAPAGTDIMAALPMDNQGPVRSMGCETTNPTFTLNGSMRTLASAASTQNEVAFKANVQASAWDCHVPWVKGLTLRKAKARLRAANCGVGHVRYVRGKHVGRVRYQPLKVGKGRPKGYKVRLAVAR